HRSRTGRHPHAAHLVGSDARDPPAATVRDAANWFLGFEGFEGFEGFDGFEGFERFEGFEIEPDESNFWNLSNLSNPSNLSNLSNPYSVNAKAISSACTPLPIARTTNCLPPYEYVIGAAAGPTGDSCSHNS